MSVPKLSVRILWWATEALLLAGVVAASAWFARPSEWHPAGLVALILVVAIVGEWFTVETTHAHLSASLGAMVLAMGLLGPAPAAAVGIGAAAAHSARARKPPLVWLNNLATYAIAPYAAGWLIRVLVAQLATGHRSGADQSIVIGLVSLAGVGLLLVINFAVFALYQRVDKGRRLLPMVRELFVPMLPGDLAPGLIAIALMLCYRAVGLLVLVAAVPVLLIFRQLTVSLVRSEQRGEKLQARTMQLASIQMAIPVMLMDALGLRDPDALRHAAAVASYSKALAMELGSSEEEQEIVHLTGLLHDIGKFTWSDRLLHPDELTDEDWETIRRHPQDGFDMVGKLDGFGPVAEGILHHHERIDGRGYPAGLIGGEIPVGSRIVAVCSTYDTMRDTLGPRMSPQDAMAELRTIAGTQLDGDLVERFITLLERNGSTFGRDADYTEELALDKRVARMAEPRSQGGASGSSLAHAAGPGGRSGGVLSTR
jgi:putative nucleotidyltransferase with HDIG domain